MGPVEEGGPRQAQDDPKEGYEQHGEVQGIFLCVPPSPPAVIAPLLGVAHVHVQHRVAD